MGFLEKVEVDEMVTYNPDLRLLQPINAAELIQEGQSTLHMPILQQPQLYYGGEYPGGYVVQVCRMKYCLKVTDIYGLRFLPFLLEI